jgi:tellurite resistance protein TerC
MPIDLTILSTAFMGKPVWLWLMFVGIVLALLVFDLGVLHRKDHVIRIRESLVLSAVYIAMGLGFGAWLWWYLGAQSGLEYVTGFLIEKTLAMDNVFVIAMIFSYFAIPAQYQHRVLFWGILGVIVLRAIMIGLGATLIANFAWVLYVFGAFLIATGIKMLLFMNKEHSVGDNWLLRFMRRHLRITPQLHGNRFWVRLPAPGAAGTVPTSSGGAAQVLWVTPLFVTLVLIEFADLIFAVDSVPAIFAITQDPFIVYTSNIFAILGLRALYFALAAMIHRFAYLKYALAAVLIFVGGKIITTHVIGKMPAWISLLITFALLAAGVVYSLYRTGRNPSLVPQSSTEKPA